MENNKPKRKYVIMYMILNLISSSILMFIMYHNFGKDIAIISGILMLIVIAIAIRYDM